jgi:hypothetical protein
MVTKNVPVAPGVPVITPVVVFIENPAGNPTALKEVGEFIAVIAYEKGTPTKAEAFKSLVIIGAEGVVEYTKPLKVKSLILKVPPLALVPHP